ncbi:MAG: hypothetical protein PHO62_08020 [Sulfurimonas sp.]|uniref:hypothetical protein n=1 Tax=Sulfurimonas sp. TaxID=2022749 RepID=UPI002601B927|nr:hypothetical protein [Sulfurimonas sp.]MDD5373354.1 hypothetical protein [Sulfurimonas sp.]
MEKYTKIVMAKTDGELKELVDAFATFYMVSSDEIAREMSTHTSILGLSDFIDKIKASGEAREVDMPDRIDYLIDLSHDADNASLELFGRKGC